MEKFTKGDWYVNHIGPHWNNPKIASHEICYSEAGECVVDHVYELADAHLIAAAPDMYRMLEQISKESCDIDIVSDIDNMLAKARGEK